MTTISLPGPLSSTPGTTSSTPGTTLVTKPVTSFPSPAGAALAAVSGRTSVPLLAPSDLPTGLSATAETRGGDYDVQLYHCRRTFGFNNPNIGAPPYCAGLGAVFGSFGAQPFPSLASNRLTGKPINTLTDLLRAPTCPQGPGTASTVILADGVQGMAESSGGELCDLRWTQRGWIIDITPSLATLSQEMPLARQLIIAVSTERLPAPRGVLSVEDAGDGEHTKAYWVQGEGLYWVGGYHLASVALSLLGSVARVSG
ncbi:MAG: hypothetical protein ACRDY2_10005 [Acidimicrobiales bacterium]